MASVSSPTPVDAARIEALTNARYHADREAFLDSVHRFFVALIIIFGLSALLDLVPWAKAGASVITAVLGVLDLVLQLVERARAHAVLKERYFDIDADLQATSPNVTKAHQAMTRLAGKEEPPFTAVHAVAENWATCSILGPSVPVPCHVSGIRWVFRHWFRHSGVSFSSGRPRPKSPVKNVFFCLGLILIVTQALMLLGIVETPGLLSNLSAG
ncbi:MAG TPA: hypothetical protein VF782_00335 [Allosphingosinicella sp.]|jgi:hypothetical protein